ncbi:hypothetical protein ACNJFJ_21395, partial [Mycobacterium tuberculosis]
LIDITIIVSHKLRSGARTAIPAPLLTNHANGDRAMADFAITRRGIVGAMMIAPVVIASPAAAVTQSDLSAKLAAHAAAVEATRQHDLQFREPASARFDAAMASRAHIEVQWGKEVWSTADHQLVAQARYMIDPTHKVKVHPA